MELFVGVFLGITLVILVLILIACILVCYSVNFASTKITSAAIYLEQVRRKVETGDIKPNKDPENTE